jgi:hypothetical protein
MVLKLETLETIQLIERLAQCTGESPETAVQIAVRERLDRMESPEAREQRRAELQALADSLAARLRASGEPLIDHGDLLYGEDGLPR